MLICLAIGMGCYTGYGIESMFESGFGEGKGSTAEHYRSLARCERVGFEQGALSLV